jgi:hypothetical protein
MYEFYANEMNPAYSVGTTHESNNYGSFVIIDYVISTNVTVMFTNTGFKTRTSVKSISLGTVKDKLKPNLFGVGFMGDGDFKSKINGSETKQYSVWRGMISRCYNKRNKAYKYYGLKGVTVCDDWHDFQNFAAWFTDNYPMDGGVYELDKDILSGCIYSPETCSIVTHKENMQEVWRGRAASC